MSDRLRFFNKKHDFLTLAQVLEITGSELFYDLDLNKKIYDVATLKNAGRGEISFVNAGQYLQQALLSNAEFCLVDEVLAQKVSAQNKNIILIVNKNPYFAYSQIAAAFYEEKLPKPTSKNIHETAKIGKNCRISPFAQIGADVEIGDDCVVYSGVVIYDGCVIGSGCIINSCAVINCAKIGKNCKIYAGAKIGQDGFGFAHDKGVNHKIIQIGIVEIGNDVEIGANSCVDRGAIDNTKIADGVKIDNLVQIGHNVEIGQGTVIAGCTAIAGSAKIGRFCQIGGNGSINGHIEIGDGAKIAGMAGVMRSIEPMQTVIGYPALPARDWYRLNAKLIAMSKGKN